MNFEKLIPSLGGTKFIITLLTGLATTLLVAFTKIDGAIYATVTLGTVGAFVAGNVTEGIKAKQADANVAIATK